MMNERKRCELVYNNNENVWINNNITKLGTKHIKLYTNLFKYIELIFVLVNNLHTYIYKD